MKAFVLLVQLSVLIFAGPAGAVAGPSCESLFEPSREPYLNLIRSLTISHGLFDVRALDELLNINRQNAVAHNPIDLMNAAGSPELRFAAGRAFRSFEMPSSSGVEASLVELRNEVATLHGERSRAHSATEYIFRTKAESLNVNTTNRQFMSVAVMDDATAIARVWSPDAGFGLLDINTGSVRNLNAPVSTVTPFRRKNGKLIAAYIDRDFKLVFEDANSGHDRTAYELAPYFPKAEWAPASARIDLSEDEGGNLRAYLVPAKAAQFAYSIDVGDGAFTRRVRPKKIPKVMKFTFADQTFAVKMTRNRRQKSIAVTVTSGKEDVFLIPEDDFVGASAETPFPEIYASTDEHGAPLFFILPHNYDRQASASRAKNLFVLSLNSGEVHALDVREFKVQSLWGVTKNQDGSIAGFFTGGDKKLVKVSLYGRTDI